MLRTAMLSAVVLLALSGPHAFAGDPSFQGLGAGTDVRDVSADGTVAVGGLANGTSGWAPFRWEAGVLTSLGPYWDAKAEAVSADGSVIVGGDFRWEGGTVSNLVSPFGAYGVSADGSVIVGVGHELGLWWGPVAARLTDGTFEMLGGDLPLRPDWLSMATGASADGSVIVGGSFYLSDLLRGVRWIDGVPSELPPGSDDYNMTFAWGVSADGNVAVGERSRGTYVTPFAGGDSDEPNVSLEACRWVNGLPEGLGVLPGATRSMAFDASGDGSSVVGCTLGPSEEIQGLLVPYEAFLWTGQEGMRRLSDVLVGDCGLDLTGWTLTEASGISDDGLTIVGNGLYDDGLGDGPVAQGWIAHIPEPASLLLLAVGASTVLRRRDRVRWRGVGAAGM